MFSQYCSYNKNNAISIQLQKFAISFFLAVFFSGFFAPMYAWSAVAPSFAKRFSGRILLQVESYGRAWYVYPKTLARYYLKNGGEAFALMRHLGLGISNSDLAQISAQIGEKSNPAIVERVKGYIVLQVEDKGQAWYVNPLDGLRYYLKDGAAAYALMRSISIGIKNADLRKIPMNDEQLVFDPTFDGVAYVAYDGKEFHRGYNADAVLPLASLTKLMTALVLADLELDWEREIVLTKEHIEYPRLYAKEEATSEIDLKEGDKIRLKDLFAALLVASSNQAARALAEVSGYSKDEFAARMNEKARAFGLIKTSFFEPSGLDANNVSTSKEMAVMARAAFAHPMIAETLRIKNYTCQITGADGIKRAIPIVDRNYSLSRFNPDVSKTGFLVEAQRNVALKKGDVIAVVLHARSMAERNNVIKKLLDGNAVAVK